MFYTEYVAINEKYWTKRQMYLIVYELDDFLTMKGEVLISGVNGKSK